MFIKDENKKIIKRILVLFKPYIKKIVAILICIFISSGISMLLPLISKNLMDNGLLARNFNIVVIFSIASFILISADQGIGMLETRYRAYINSIMSYELSKAAFKHLFKLKIQYFNNTNFSEIMSNIGMDVGNISRISDRSTFFIITQVFRIFGGVIGLLIIDWKLTILVIGIVPIRYMLVKYLARKRKQLFEKYMEYMKDFSSWYGDTISGVKEIKLWGIDRIKTGQYIKKQRNIIKTNIKMTFMDKINELSETILFQIITNTLYILGAFMLFQNTLTVGALFAFLTYSAYVTGPVSAILNIGYSFSNILPSAKRYFEFLDMECESADTYDTYENTYENTYEKKARKIQINDSVINGNIRFEDVSFSYKQGEPVLRNIDLEIRSGEKIAIIGANGSGKTTIVNLLLRFYRPDSGRIFLDGTDINEFGLRDYRRLISVVSQDLYLFNASIEENIALSEKKNSIDIFKAARQSCANDFIGKMPDKYKSLVGRNGAKLSGGERQKIAMARAFARNSRIMILDEATSSYDAESEVYVNELLGSYFKDRTVVVISHKPDILKQLDKIIFLENGSIKDIGSHDSLFGSNKYYRDMFENIRAESKNAV